MPAWGIAGALALIVALFAVPAVVSATAEPATPYVRPSDAFAEPTQSACTPISPALSTVTSALNEDPSAVRLAVVGDSTRDAAIAQSYYATLTSLLPETEIGGFGYNGVSIDAYMSDPAKTQAIVDFAPTVIELSIGINDVRRDQDAPVAERLETFVNDLHARIPDAAIVLSVPAALSTTDVGGLGYVTAPDGTVNPEGAAQAVTTALHAAYTNLGGSLDFVFVNDVQTNITGTDADRTEPPRFLADQLHPSPTTQEMVAESVANALLGTCA